MSSFTKHTAIAPTDNGNWITTEWFRYYVGELNSNDYIDVPTWFEFDGASVPNIFGIFIQKVEPDTIMSACLHDYLYIHRREYGRIKSDQIFLESLIIYNIPHFIKNKEYITWLIYMFKYILMYTGLFIWSWFVWYKIEKRVKALFTNMF